MNAPAARLSAWLRACRGDETQEHLAEDISQVTGWNITRDRYSKYESGSLPIGKRVLQHFVDYWATRGVDGPATMPVPEPPVDPLVAALGAQTQALNRQAAAIEELVARFDQLASEAIRQGVVDALREAGADPTGGASPASPRAELTA